MALSDAPRCTATAKRTGQRCRNPAVAGFTVCRHHGAGGKTNPGERPPVTGRHSKWLPRDLLARYQAGLRDPALLELKDEIAVLDARIAQVGARLGTGEGQAAWAALRDVHQRLSDAIAASDPQGLRDGMAAFLRAIEQAEAEQETWNALCALFDQRRRLAESQRKIEESAQRILTDKEATALIAALIDSVRRHERDPKVLSAIAADLRGLVGTFSPN